MSWVRARGLSLETCVGSEFLLLGHVRLDGIIQAMNVLPIDSLLHPRNCNRCISFVLLASLASYG